MQKKIGLRVRKNNVHTPQASLNFKEFINFCKSHGLIFRGGLLSTVRAKLELSLHQPFMVFITQVTACELVFQTVSNCVSFIGRV
jgi:hypothetical protein